MQVRDITVESADRNLKATLFSPEAETVPGVICFPGYKSKRELYYEHGLAIAEKVGAACLTVDISGHGETPGDLQKLTAQDLEDDALAAYDALAEQPNVDQDRMGIIGTSFGGRLAVLLTCDRNPKSLLLRAPSIKEELPVIPDPVDQPPEEKGLLTKILGRSTPIYDVVAEAYKVGDYNERLKAYLPRAGSLLRILNDYAGSVTIVESELDPHIDSKYIQACLTVAQNGTHAIIEGAGHMLNEEERLKYREIILDWAAAL